MQNLCGVLYLCSMDSSILLCLRWHFVDFAVIWYYWSFMHAYVNWMSTNYSDATHYLACDMPCGFPSYPCSILNDLDSTLEWLLCLLFLSFASRRLHSAVSSSPREGSEEVFLLPNFHNHGPVFHHSIGPIFHPAVISSFRLSRCQSHHSSCIAHPPLRTRAPTN